MPASIELSLQIKRVAGISKEHSDRLTEPLAVQRSWIGVRFAPNICFRIDKKLPPRFSHVGKPLSVTPPEREILFVHHPHVAHGPDREKHAIANNALYFEWLPRHRKGGEIFRNHPSAPQCLPFKSDLKDLMRLIP